MYIYIYTPPLTPGTTTYKSLEPQSSDGHPLRIDLSQKLSSLNPEGPGIPGTPPLVTPTEPKRPLAPQSHGPRRSMAPSL